MSPVITQVVFDLIHQEQTDEATEANNFWLWQDFDELESMYKGFEGERGSHLYLTCNKPILQIFKDRSGKR